MSNDDLITIATFDKRGDAELCRVILDQGGIRSFIADENAASGLGFITLTVGGIKVQIAKDDAQVAQDLLKNFRGEWGAIHEETTEVPPNVTQITAACESCGSANTFLVADAGSIKTCPQCHEYMDVPEV